MDKQKKQISEQNCADCIHAEVCAGYEVTMPACKHFADKSLYIKLPCKVGDTMFDISEFVYDYKMPEMHEDKVEYIELQIDRKSGELIFYINGIYWRYFAFGKTVFLSREEAEAALEERNER